MFFIELTEEAAAKNDAMAEEPAGVDHVGLMAVAAVCMI